MSALPEKLNRGLSMRRLRVGVRDPFVIIRNLKFNWARTRSAQSHIFIVGPPRSGTELIKNLLNVNPNITAVNEETSFFLRRNYTDFSLASVPHHQMRAFVEQARDAVHLFDLFADEIAGGNQRFLEKTPEHATRIDFILKHFPAAQIIFLIRDGRDGYVSALRKPDFLRTLRDVGSPLEAYAAVWNRCVSPLIRFRDHPAIHMIRYEDLCNNPERILMKAMTFLHEKYDPDQLNPGSFSNTSLSTQVGHTRLKEQIAPKTVGQYRTAMDKAEIDRFQKIAGPELSALKYTLD